MSVQTHELGNGVRVVTEAMPGLHSASIGIWVSAGGRHERAEQNGIAHFLEHMAFKGTHRRNALEIAETIEDVGGYINAYTSREVTAYYARVLQGDVALAFDVIADIVTDSVFDEREIEVERGVILQEIGQVRDTPDDIVFDWLQEQAFPDQPLGRSILGPPERVQNFTKSDLVDFVREQYRPNQLIVCAAGAVDHDAICRQAEKLLGHLEDRKAPSMTPARFVGGERRENKSLEQVHMVLGLPAPSYTSEDIYTAQIFAIAMGGGMSSRLFQELRERRGLCYSVFAGVSSFADGGLFTIYAGTDGAQISELADVTIDEMRRSTEDMSAVEVARARAQIKAGMLMGLESASNRAERLARLMAIWGRIPSLDETIERIDGVTTGDVRAYGEAMAQSRQTAFALYGPAETAPYLVQLTERLAA